jgi:hypothetical protein
MGRSAYGRRATCESCLSVDVREWHRQGLLRHAGLRFTSSWTRHGQPLGSIDVRTEANAVVLTIKGGSECRSVEQRVPLVGTCTTSVVHVPGSDAQRTSAGGSAGGAQQSYTCVTPRFSCAVYAAP